MKFKELQRNWEGFGKEDPFWSVLTEPDKINNQWEESEFFKTGRQHVNYFLGKSGILDKVSKGKALDFGCGPGRLTQPLAQHFEEVHGVDISAHMIELANKLNKKKKRVSFHVNATNDLSLFENHSFDFIFSLITLQHMSPNFMKDYLKEFCRILKEDGYALFNIPTEAPLYHKFLKRIIGESGINLIRRLYYGKSYVMEVHSIAKIDVETIMNSNGCKVVHTFPSDFGRGWKGLFYVIQKKSN